MLLKIKNIFKNSTFKELLDPNNAGLYVFAIIMLAITWSAVGVLQQNYALEKQIAKQDQENAVQELINRNHKLKNEYFKSNQYLELSARRQFGKALPGEKVITVPRDIALRHVAALPKSDTSIESNAQEEMSFVEQNLQDWFDFFTHRLSD